MGGGGGCWEARGDGLDLASGGVDKRCKRSRVLGIEEAVLGAEAVEVGVDGGGLGLEAEGVELGGVGEGEVAEDVPEESDESADLLVEGGREGDAELGGTEVLGVEEGGGVAHDGVDVLRGGVLPLLPPSRPPRAAAT